MSAMTKIRFVAGCSIYWLIWLPVALVRAPFMIWATFVSWLSWDVHPAVAKASEPVFHAIHGFADQIGTAVAGPDIRAPTKET